MSAPQLYRRRSQRRGPQVPIYGKTVTLEAFVGVVIPSRTLGNEPILVVIFPQRSGPWWPTAGCACSRSP